MKAQNTCTVPTANHYHTLYKYTGHTLKYFKNISQYSEMAKRELKAIVVHVPLRRIHWVYGVIEERNF